MNQNNIQLSKNTNKNNLKKKKKRSSKAWNTH